MDRAGNSMGAGKSGLLISAFLLLLAGCDAPTSPQELSMDQNELSDSALPGSGQDSGRTVVYRDTFGIPHIYAPTVEAGLYAQGWTQAEDRPEQLLTNLKLAMGEFTEVAGEDGVQISLLARMFGHMRNATASVANMSEQERARITAFASMPPIRRTSRIGGRMVG